MKPILFVFFLLSALTFICFMFMLAKELRKSFERQEPPNPNLIVLVIMFIILIAIEAVAMISLMLN